MAIRGSEEKQMILDTLKKSFPGTFQNGKEWRVPIGGVEIKVSLVCAKDLVGGGSTTSFPEPIPASPSAEEKANVAALIGGLF